jgi:hypothetical protein
MIAYMIIYKLLNNTVSRSRPCAQIQNKQKFAPQQTKEIDYIPYEQTMSNEEIAALAF